MSRPILADFRELGIVAQQTRQLLVHRTQARRLTPQQCAQLDATLRHLGAVREGLQLSLRSGSGAMDELRDIVRYTLHALDWGFLEELGLTLQQDDQVQKLDVQLMAFAHATVALAMLPMLPSSEISHPASSHYRDLHTPRRPGEWLERIEELESVLVRLQADTLAERGAAWARSAALRRAHAYFDVSAWLVRSHLQRFGCD